jgi:hypothetical protein
LAGGALADAGALPPAVLALELQASPPSASEAQDRDTTGLVTLPHFLAFWRSEIEPFDLSDRFFRVVKQRRAAAIEPLDFMPFLEELLAYHPGLAFLEATSEFQDKYARTVIARIFYVCDPTARQAVDSNVTAAFNTVDVEEDINQVANFFSYEHFYVLYWRVPRLRRRRGDEPVLSAARAGERRHGGRGDGRPPHARR